MSLLSWFSPKKKPQARAHGTRPSDLSRLDSTRQQVPGSDRGNPGQPSNRKQERLERREMLYAVVREAMVRAGVLSSSYKFKVLSLDPRGRQFMVMVDLAEGAASDTSRLAEIEAMIAQSAKARYDIAVGAVYWRANEHVAIGDAAHFTAHKPMISQPAPLFDHHPAATSRPAPLMSELVSRPAELRAAPPARTQQRFEPVAEDEVNAFRKALDVGVRGEQALAAAAQSGAGAQGQSYTLLTGFEDTEMADGAQELSGTQFGALR
ncbi:hypothetical protein [Ramlibacter sp.]|uniref:hypothetical protein n=1 Tax=Ramlibacter sp. TaxID=1917967 RepID=UPI002608693B|nr:hypothetical protein [Ramlibacter sp.]MDB5958040.1 hypothetical protein [Ramlibacter sp.]